MHLDVAGRDVTRNLIALLTIDSPRIILALDYLFDLQAFVNARYVVTDDCDPAAVDTTESADLSVAGRVVAILRARRMHVQTNLLERTRIEQVINNLVSNAIKYSPANRSVFVSSAIVDGNCEIRIRDEGSSGF